MSEHLASKLVAGMAEHNWTKRRRLVFGFAIFFCVFFFLVAALIMRLAVIYPTATPVAINVLGGLCMYLSVLGGLISTYYMVAPTGENLAAIAGAVSAAKSGMSLSVGPGPDPVMSMTAGDTNLEESTR